MKNILVNSIDIGQANAKHMINKKRLSKILVNINKIFETKFKQLKTSEILNEYSSNKIFQKTFNELCSDNDLVEDMQEFEELKKEQSRLATFCIKADKHNFNILRKMNSDRMGM